jgi:4-diphosphocytidyl-2-C-methyl-D-erythritol kinase
MSAPRRARLRALAKINLDLRVLARRDDGYHELRTIFQTISLADTIEIAFTPGHKTSIVLAENSIPDNLVVRAAQAAMDAMRSTGRVEMRLAKRVPMGGGLGGGSSDAAAILLALPVLAGREVALPDLCRIGQQLGSDVPFFLLGGTAVGIGRGSELFPLPDAAPLNARAGVLAAPGVHVSTAEAYRSLDSLLDASLTTELQENKIFSFQSLTWEWGTRRPSVNDFEAVVFREHGCLARLKKRLLQAGAVRAMMTGSGSAVFGLYRTAEEASRAMGSLREKDLAGGKCFRFNLVSRARYRSLWWRALDEHAGENVWPPRSRYLR